MQALLKLTKMELKLQFREPIALFFTLVFPVMLMIFLARFSAMKPKIHWVGMVR